MEENVKLKKNFFGSYVLSYACPACGELLSSSVNDAGKQDSCPTCNRVFVVPGMAHKQAVDRDRENNERKLQEIANAKELEKQLRLNLARQKKEAEESAARERAENANSQIHSARPALPAEANSSSHPTDGKFDNDQNNEKLHVGELTSNKPEVNPVLGGIVFTFGFIVFLFFIWPKDRTANSSNSNTYSNRNSSVQLEAERRLNSIDNNQAIEDEMIKESLRRELMPHVDPDERRRLIP